jgi:hypothetical protein
MVRHYSEETKQKNRDRAKRWREANPDRYKTRQANLLDKRRSLFAGLKSESICYHCGEDDSEVLQFDHKDPKTKKCYVGERLTAINSFWEEFHKCQILCANCHLKKGLENQDFLHWKRL